MFGPLGLPEMMIILVVALIVFGPRKLPELGRSLGKSLSEFKRASNELRSTLDEEIRIEEQKNVAARPQMSTPASTDPSRIGSPADPDTIARGEQGA
jgi:TatA/E family protein of Tat protein translocase